MPTARTGLRATSSLAAIGIAVVASSAAAADKEGNKPAPLTAWEASRIVKDNDKMATGTARARDRLDSATSTSSLPETEITKLSPRTLAELFRNIPGVRVEAAAGDVANSYSVRGLPLVTEGAKYLQLQEDGLPVLEFGDFLGHGVDSFIRFDLNVAQVESIRGGSASTFASNAPGGVVNLLSKTGEVEGGSAQLTGGLNYNAYRLDADYGGHLGDDWRFHVGGYYRRGDGPRATGFASTRGGQIKLNLTRRFTNGYIRVYGKYLDDHTPLFNSAPVALTGTEADPHFATLPGFSIKSDSGYSKYINNLKVVDNTGRVRTFPYRDGMHAKVKSAGFEAQIDAAGWSFSDRFRYAEMSNYGTFVFTGIAATPAQLGGALHIPGATFTYASGPLQGKPFDATRGTGLVALTLGIANDAPDLGDVTNDARASRVWRAGGGDLTTTAGLYAARQNFNRQSNLSTLFQDVVGDGGSSLINLAAAGGAFPITENGYLLYSAPGNNGNAQYFDVSYRILAPYGSVNFHRGKISVGGSLRYDTGHVAGTVSRSDSGNLGCVDIDGNGQAVGVECTAALFPAANNRPIDYHYHYLSYSAGVNVRAAEPLAFFARYSKGARAAAEAILFSPALDRATGHLLNPAASYDPVRQAEAGVKFRKNGLTFNATVFHATTSETNTQLGQDASGNAVVNVVSSAYKAYGAELEGGVRRGPFSVTASGILAHGEITGSPDATLIGHRPRHQPTLIYQVTPQYDSGRFSLGINILGVTSSYAADTNRLKIPGYRTVGLFAQYSPIDRLVLSVNASNVFDTLAITETGNDAIPAGNVGLARSLAGRTVSASTRLFF